MKKYILSIVVILLFGACNNSFLDKKPIEKLTEELVFSTNSNFQAYALSMYSLYTETTLINDAISQYDFRQRGDAWGGNLRRCGYNAADYNTPHPYNARTPRVQATGTSYSEMYCAGGWDFSYVRRICTLLDNIPSSTLSEAEKKHWRSVGYFWHSLLYMNLLSRYGDVIWVDHVLGTTDPVAYGKRTPRAVVADSIMTHLLYAEANMEANGANPVIDGPNTINKACVQVLISRFGLFEGTWRKYHAGTVYGVDETSVKYNKTAMLTQAARASLALISNSRYGIDATTTYDGIMNSPDLSTNKEMILYKEYVGGVIMHTMGRYCRSAEVRFEIPKHTMDLFLTRDGKPIHNATNQSPKANTPNNNDGMFCGDKNVFNEFRNRDERLYVSVVPPYFDATLTGYNYTAPTAFNVDVNEFKNYLTTMPSLASSKTKRLPVHQFFDGTTGNEGTTATSTPFAPQPTGPNIKNWLRTQGGYCPFRHYNIWDNNSGDPTSTADKPIYRMGEILLNYAEAKWELGQFDQGIADVSINKLRTRANVAPMTVGAIGADFDPVRDPTVDPVLWEIRRERIVELLGEGFGYDDVRRWSKGPWYFNRNITGFYFRRSDYKNGTVTGWNNLALVDDNFNDVTVAAPAGEGYIKRFKDLSTSGAGWDDTFYLVALPLNDLALNKNLTQNPGWEKY
jgi:starch-binding outer membrane protein, SusD/RagB family